MTRHKVHFSSARVRAVCALLVVYSIVGCANPNSTTARPVTSPVPSEALSGSTPTATPIPTPTLVPTPAPFVPEENPAVAETAITITFDGTTLGGVLHPSAATAGLVSQLPLNLEFSDFAGQEMHASLPHPLSQEGMPDGSAANAGMIGYYAPNQVLVLYYDSVGYFPGIIPLGNFDGVPAVKNAAQFSAVISVGGR